MKALCVTPDRILEVRELPNQNEAAPGHVLVDMAASAINHGDKTFLKNPMAAGGALALGQHEVWGASGAGTIIATGAGVPSRYAGKRVAIYRSLDRTPQCVGLWCETAHVPHTTCVILPDGISMKDFSGSLVNVMTAYAFLEEIAEAGHQAVIVTAGGSATGHAVASLARTRKLPMIFLVRSEVARQALLQSGAEHVIVTDQGMSGKLGPLAAQLKATAVFDGVGGELIGKIAPCLPMNSTVYFYGFLGGDAPLVVPSVLFMMKNLTMRRFSNFESKTVKHREKLLAALSNLEGLIDDPLFHTNGGREFGFEQIDQALAYEPRDGRKAILVA